MDISVSILTCDFTNLKEELDELKKRDLKYLHLDVMDGCFVPSITFGGKLVQDLLKYKDDVIFDAHLMVKDPLHQVLGYKGVDYLTIHYESEHVKETLDLIKTFTKCGISIKPDSNVEDILEYLPEVDMVLVMSVEPGKGGQKFMPSALDKISKLAKLREENNYHYIINVDGGINLETAKLVKEAGVDVAVSGSFVINDYDNLTKLNNL